MEPVQINLWGVVAATAFAMVVGALWYSDLILGKQWQKAAGKKAADITKGAGTIYLVTALLWLLTSYVLAHFVGYAAADTWLEGAVVGLWVWIGFVFTTGLIHVLFDGRPKRLFAINAGYTLVALVGMGAIIVLLPN